MGSICRYLREISLVRRGSIRLNWNHIGTTGAPRLTPLRPPPTGGGRRGACHRDRVLRRPSARLMATATVHVSAADLQLDGSYEPIGDVLYLS